MNPCWNATPGPAFPTYIHDLHAHVGENGSTPRGDKTSSATVGGRGWEGAPRTRGPASSCESSEAAEAAAGRSVNRHSSAILDLDGGAEEQQSDAAKRQELRVI
ncbi:hypothetical protein EYF80_036914 [Liparis tanakae]|uniref:Uncharacterized protein n=1 Tax=Liparis tanakae TaxID=230148 RepID=A0A4Z2GI91_9TELE|nr:hypothetical protein EYF80_036914 [Liparis tanakae]